MRATIRNPIDRKLLFGRRAHVPLKTGPHPRFHDVRMGELVVHVKHGLMASFSDRTANFLPERTNRAAAEPVNYLQGGPKEKLLTSVKGAYWV